MVGEPSLLGRRKILSPEYDTGNSADIVSCNALEGVDDADIETSQVPKKKSLKCRKPGSTKSTSESLTSIIALHNTFNEIELAVSNSDDQANHPPEVPSSVDKFLPYLFDLRATFIAGRCRWKKDFSLLRMRDALVRRFGKHLLTSSLKMSSNGKKLSTRERIEAEANVDISARPSQRAGPLPSVPRDGTTTALAPKSRRPELERDIAVATYCRPGSSPRHRDDAMKRDNVVESGRKLP